MRKLAVFVLVLLLIVSAVVFTACQNKEVKITLISDGEVFEEIVNPKEVLGYEVLEYPEIIWDGTDEEILAQITIRVTYVDGTTLDTTGDIIPSAYYAIEHDGGYILIDILLNVIRIPGEPESRKMKSD